jgi:hypothetical protein
MIDFQFLSLPENAKAVTIALTKTYDELNKEPASNDEDGEGKPWGEIRDIIAKHVGEHPAKEQVVDNTHKIIRAQNVCIQAVTRNAIAVYNQCGIPAADFAFCLLYSAANFDAVTEENRDEDDGAALSSRHFLQAAGFAYVMAQISMRNMKRHVGEIPAKDH